MYYEPPTEEQKKEILEKIAHLIVEKEMEAPAIMFLETIKPLSFMGSQLTLFTLAPFLAMLGEHEEKGYNLIRLFEKEENVEYVLQRIETLSKEKRSSKEKSVPREEKGLKERIKSFLKKFFG